MQFSRLLLILILSTATTLPAKANLFCRFANLVAGESVDKDSLNLNKNTKIGEDLADPSVSISRPTKRLLFDLSRDEKLVLSENVDRLLMQNTQKTAEEVSQSPYDVVMIGAGVQAIVSLASMLEFRSIFSPLRVLVIDPSTPAATFDRKDFYLNSPNYLNLEGSTEKSDATTYPNNLPGLKYQTLHFETRKPQPHSQDLALAVKLNFLWLAQQNNLQLDYLREEVDLDLWKKMEDFRRLPILRGESSIVLDLQTDSFVVGTGMSKLEDKKNALVARAGTDYDLITRSQIEEALTSNSKRDLKKFLFGKAISGSNFLYLYSQLSKERRERLLKYDIGIIGAGHESFTIMEALSNTARMKANGEKLYRAPKVNEGQVTIFAEGLESWSDLDAKMLPPTPNVLFNQMIYDRYKRNRGYRFEKYGSELAFGPRIESIEVKQSKNSDYKYLRLSSASGSKTSLDFVILATQKDRFAFLFDKNSELTSAVDLVVNIETAIMSDPVVLEGTSPKRTNEMIDAVVLLSSHSTKVRNSQSTDVAEVYLNGVARLLTEKPDVKTGIPNQEAITNRVSYSRALGIGLANTEYRKSKD